MTDHEIIRAVAMRLNGATWKDIGEILHYDHSTAFHCVKRAVLHGGRSRSNHPHVRIWMLRNGITNEMIAKRAGVQKLAVSRSLNSEKMSKKVLEAICSMSDLTPEQVRYMESEESHDTEES